MEKTIILTPALAALTMAGVNKVIGLKERPELFERLLLFSRGPVFNYESPIELIMETHNQTVFGKIPPIEKMAKEAIIGIVEMGKEADKDDATLWGKMAGGTAFHVSQCFTFDNPVKCALNQVSRMSAEELMSLFPAHSICSQSNLVCLGGTLGVSMSKEFFELVSYSQRFFLDLTDEVKRELLDEDSNLKNFKKLLLICGNRNKWFEFKAEISTQLNAKMEPMLYNSVLEPSGKDIRRQIVFECKTQLFI